MSTSSNNLRTNGMPPSQPSRRTAALSAVDLTGLIDALWALRQSIIERPDKHKKQLSRVDPANRASALNLLHFLALRKHDLRPVQEALARLGVSSLGRAESAVLANLDKVLHILHRLDGRVWTPLEPDEPLGMMDASAVLAQRAKDLFGPSPAGRQTRIMVTLPTEAAHDTALVDALVEAGMDIARINCAHDDARAWAAMAASVRRAAKAQRRAVLIHMDVAGPKLRTGPMAEGPAVLRVKPARDALGRVMFPGRLWLVAAADATRAGPAGGLREPLVGVDDAWLAAVREGDRIDLVDARGAHRLLHVETLCDDVGAPGRHAVVTCDRTVYLTPQTRLRLHRDDTSRRETVLHGIRPLAGSVRLHRGDRIDLVATGLGQDAEPSAPARKARRARIVCSLPEVMPRVRSGERIAFDDGRIHGVVVRAGRTSLQVEITDAPAGGARLIADKGINLPDTDLGLPALTDQDIQDLSAVAQAADLVGLSFAQTAADVRALRDHLAAAGADHLGIVLKLETKRGFANLPEMLMAALEGHLAGVMIARGDLAVECGWERMAEVQEEVLWACEAAHIPVVWATQVLETLAKTGQPSRAEITDAAMGGRAECVMLNKGPYVLDAIRSLDDILRRMQAHQSKKRPLLRALTAW
jgi:pyruvate kinase